MAQPDPVSVQVARGKPIQVRGHRLIPIARIFSIREHRALITSSHVHGSGWGAVHAQPIEIIQVTDGGEQHIPIPDPTARILLQMLAIAVITAFISIGLILANRCAARQSVRSKTICH